MGTKKQRKNTKTRNGSDLFFSFLKMGIIVLIVILIYLKMKGVHNIQDFKRFARKNPKLKDALSLTAPTNELEKAEQYGKKVLKSLSSKEKRLKDVRQMFQQFLVLQRDENFEEVYNLFSTEDRLQLSQNDFLFKMKSQTIEWSDPDIDKEFRLLLNKKTGKNIKDVIINFPNAQVVVQTSIIEVNSHLPDSKDIENYYKLSESEVERETSRIVLEKLKNGQIPVENKLLVHDLIYEDDIGWRVQYLKGTTVYKSE
jgi:hypothetical protein